MMRAINHLFMVKHPNGYPVRSQEREQNRVSMTPFYR